MGTDEKAELLCTRDTGCERIKRMRGAPALWIFVVLLVWTLNFAGAESLWAQQGPPPPPPPPHGRPGPPRLDARAIVDHIQKVRRHLEEIKPNDQDREMLLALARRNLDRAEEKAHANDLFVADRLVTASDAFVRAAERPLHLEEGPKAPKGPHPDAEEIATHLQRVYFRLQQADYFAQASGDENAKQLPGLARKFYEKSLQAYDEQNWLEAEECARSADDTIRGLENLAQSATPLPPRPR
jgi:hypothetical protein